jgi:hypothetical protein
MARTTFVALFSIVLAFAAGCTRRSLSSIPDGGTPCSSLTPSQCQQEPGCVLAPGCCNSGQVCLPANEPVPLCPGIACSVCSGLTESACKANPTCHANYCNGCSCTPQPQYVGCTANNSPPMVCPGIACVPNCNCNGLDEQSCIAAESSRGCTPGYCAACNGVKQFVQCLGPNQGPIVCEPPACPPTCHEAKNCPNGEECVAPGASPGCGVCRIDPVCNVDTDCGSGQVCDVAPCVCNNNGRICIQACQSAKDCGAGDACTNGHCVPLPCSNTTQCPPYFDCVVPPTSAAPQCQRRACSIDSECSGGFCVDGACYGALGMCTFPPP